MGVLLVLSLADPLPAAADGFLDDGVIENSDSLQSGVVATAVGHDGLYVAGLDHTSGTGSWRVEKRRLDDGELVPSFGEGGVLAVDPTAGWDGIHAILADGRSLFLVGNADGELRIEKRSTAGGRLRTAFGVAGAVAFPGDAFFAVGVHNSRRRIEKRRLVDGSLVEQFGNGGVLDGARRVREAFSAVSICGDLVVTGFASSVGSFDRWYSTRHDPISGALAAGPRAACVERTPR